MRFSITFCYNFKYNLKKCTVEANDKSYHVWITKSGDLYKQIQDGIIRADNSLPQEAADMALLSAKLAFAVGVLVATSIAALDLDYLY